MGKLTYTDKVDLTTSTVPDINKVVANDMNEIKTVVNGNDDLMGDLSTLTTTNKSNIVSAINEINSKTNIITDGSEVQLDYKIDNKFVYAKRFSIPSLTNRTAVAHGLSNFVLQDYEVMTLANNVYRKLNYATATVYYVIDVDNTNINLYTNGTLSGTGHITLFYTKTS
jgi:hypothetical protein